MFSQRNIGFLAIQVAYLMIIYPGGSSSETFNCWSWINNGSCSSYCGDGILEIEEKCVSGNNSCLPGKGPCTEEELETTRFTSQPCSLAECPNDYKHVGCWEDRFGNLIESIENGVFPLCDNWSDRDHAIERCADAAREQYGFSMFALTNGGQCLTVSEGEATFYKYGSSNKCQNGVGGNKAIDVYLFNHFLEESTITESYLSVWTPWEWESCSLPCGGGQRNRYKYCIPIDQIPCNSVPDPESENCNTEDCPWSENEKKYQWLGCWKNPAANNTFQFDVESLDLDVLDVTGQERILPVDKCAIAMLSQAFKDSPAKNDFFGIQQGNCRAYRENQPATDYMALGPADCDKEKGGYDTVSVYSTATDLVVNAQWSAWSEYGSCNQICGSGLQERVRTCTNPPPADPDDPESYCQGSHSSSQECSGLVACPAIGSIGCWIMPAQIESLEGQDELLSDNYSNRSHPVEKCALASGARNFTVFALRNGSECFSGELLQCHFDSNGTLGPDCTSAGAASFYLLNSDIPDQPLSIDFLECLKDGQDYLEAQVQYATSKDALAVTQSISLLKRMKTDEFEKLGQFSETLELFQVIVGKTQVTHEDESIAAYLEEVTSTASHLLDTANEALLKEEPFNNTSQIMEIVENAGLTISKFMTKGTTIYVNSKNINLEVSVITPSSVSANVPVPTSSTKDNEFKGGSTTLPASYFQAKEFQGVEKFAIVTASFENITSLLSNASAEIREDAYLVGSYVISVATDPPLQTLPFQEPVTLVLNHDAPLPSTDTPSAVCVFWDYNTLPFSSLNYGAWSDKGCQLVFSDQTHSVCECDHLTSFAVLVKVSDYEIPQVHKKALSIITYVCCVISILALITSFTVFVYLDNLTSDRTAIHKNLIIAIGLGQVIFLTGIQATSSKIACKLVAIVLHFFYLSAFTWMLNEGIHLYSKVVEVFKNHKMLYYYLIGWGIPVVIVGISVGIGHDNYGNGDYCWLSLDNGLVWAFVGPVLGIILVNFIIMVMVVRIIVSSSVASIVPTKKEKHKEIKSAMKGMMILLPILGITWLFGILAVDQHLLFLEYMFAILNSLQGFFIFVFHCLGNSEVRNAFRRKKEQLSSKHFNTVEISSHFQSMNSSKRKESEDPLSTSSQIHIILTPAEGQNSWASGESPPPYVTTPHSRRSSNSSSYSNRKNSSPANNSLALEKKGKGTTASKIVGNAKMVPRSPIRVNTKNAHSNVFLVENAEDPGTPKLDSRSPCSQRHATYHRPSHTPTSVPEVQ